MSSSANNSKNTSDESKTVIPYTLTAEGSLGVLALGAAGISAWRKKREEEKLKNIQKEKNE